MNSVKKTDRKINKHGFTMIELIGAMVIIAILTVAGITAIATAINNSRMSATQTDLSGFRTPIEQFMLENPQMAKATNVDYIATELNKYLEGEMQFISVPSGQAGDPKGTASADPGASDSLYYATPDKGGWQLKRKDAWDQNFRVYIQTANHWATQGSNDAKDTELRIFVISNGTNSTTGYGTNYATQYIDGDDDLFLMVQMVNGQVSSGYYGFDDGDSVFAGDGSHKGTDGLKELTDEGSSTVTTSIVGTYRENGHLDKGSISDLSKVVFANTVTAPKAKTGA